jgi:hypothetical protein
MVGSDLESLDGCATDDIGEMLEGIPDSYIDTDISTPQDGYDLLIAYGGALKMGWKGMTIANLDDINSDYQNGIIGDEEKFRFQDNRINMGSEEGLNRFIQYIEDQDSYKRYVLFFWDHGDSYAGVCFDENYDMDPLDLLELRSVLSSSTIHWDLIGMDACLMGSYEVARSVEGFANYLMVSEEAEPGHGWSYTLPFYLLSLSPEMSIADWGKIWIDEYMDNPTHDKNKKTLALIDLNQIHTIEEGLSGLSLLLNQTITDMRTYNGVGVSISGSQRYGYDPRMDQERSIDLFDLTLHLDQVVPEGASYLSSIRRAISESVVYERNDGSRPGSNGVSIFSPRTKQLYDFEYVSKTAPLNAEWEEFITRYMTFISQDDRKPVISSIGDGKYRITDDQGLAYVRIDTDWMPDILNLSHSYGLKSEPVYSSEPDIYIPAPDDQTFYIRDTVSGEMVPFFHSYIGVDNQGFENYFGYIQIIRSGRTKEAVINPIRNPDTNEMTFALYPYELMEDGQMLFSKVPALLKPGDSIVPKIVERFLGSDDPRWQYSPYTTLMVQGDVEIVRDRLPYGSYYSTLTASDYNGNFAMEIIGTLRFPNNSSVVSTELPE